MVNGMQEPSNYPVTKPEAEWKAELTPEEYHVLREKGTERAFVGEYTDQTEDGTYSCKACGAELFPSGTKFHSGCGWPSFFDGFPDAIEYHEDKTFGMSRVEVLCKKCGSHLGHVFDDAPKTPTGQRYCINSVSLQFKPGAPI